MQEKLKRILVISKLFQFSILTFLVPADRFLKDGFMEATERHAGSDCVFNELRADTGVQTYLRSHLHVPAIFSSAKVHFLLRE